MSPEPTPFKLNVPDEDIKDLRDRLSRTRFPDQDPGEEWETGTPVSALKRLVDRWKNGFDWRGVESRLNELDQFEVEVAGAKVHYLHVKPKAGKGTPLLLMHGWPGSVLEFLDILPMLTEPEKWGGRTEDAFEVIAPSLPG